MKKQVVILADRNYEQYLMMLQLKFVEEKSDEVELVVVTGPGLLSGVLQYAAQRRRAHC